MNKMAGRDDPGGCTTRARGETGQALMTIVALLAVLTVIPVISLTQTYDELPVMSRSNLQVYAGQAARSGLQLFENAVSQDPRLLGAFPSPSNLVPADACPTDSSSSWTTVAVAAAATGQPAEQVIVAVSPPSASDGMGLATVFAEARAGSPGHWVCTEQKLTTYLQGPVLDGPSPGKWESYQVPTWTKAVYASIAGANGLGCTTWLGDSNGGCAYSADGSVPSAGNGAAFVAALPLPQAGGTIGIGVGAVPTSPFDPDAGMYAAGGQTLWKQATGSGFWNLARKFLGIDSKNLMASFPGGGATMLLWCPSGATCEPGTQGAQVLAVAGGGGGSGSDGSSYTLIAGTLLPGGNGGAAGGQSVSEFSNLSGTGSWSSCGAGGCSAVGHSGQGGGGVVLLGGGGAAGGGGGSGQLAGGSAVPSADCFGGLPFGFGNSTIYFSGGGGGGGYNGGAQGNPGSTFNNVFDCAVIAGSGGGGGGSSYVEPGSQIMPASVKPNPDGNGDGYAELWFSTAEPGAPAPSSCASRVLVGASSQSQDIAAVVTGASGQTNHDATGGGGAVLPVLVEVPSNDNLVESCAPGGSGGDTTLTPTPSGQGGAATVLCLTPGDGDQCNGDATPLVVAGGGGGAGDQGNAGLSFKACLSSCDFSNVLGLVTLGFAAGPGGNAGFPPAPGNMGAEGGSGGARGTLAQGSISFSIFGWNPSWSWSLAWSNGGQGAGSSGGSGLGSDGQAGGAGESGQVFQWSPWNGYTSLEGGSGGGGGGYTGGGAGGTDSGGSTYQSWGTGISCGLFGCWGIQANFGWFTPGGGGGGGSSWAGGAIGASYGWLNDAPPTSAVPWGGLAQSPGGVTILGSWPAKTMTGPMVVASVPVGPPT